MHQPSMQQLREDQVGLVIFLGQAAVNSRRLVALNQI